MKKSELNKIIKEEVEMGLSGVPGEGFMGRKKRFRKRNEIKSDILNSWAGSDVAQADLEIFLEMIYTDGNHDTMDDMKEMFGYLSSVANDYYKKMQ